MRGEMRPSAGRKLPRRRHAQSGRLMPVRPTAAGVMRQQGAGAASAPVASVLRLLGDRRGRPASALQGPVHELQQRLVQRDLRLGHERGRLRQLVRHLLLDVLGWVGAGGQLRVRRGAAQNRARIYEKIGSRILMGSGSVASESARGADPRPNARSLRPNPARSLGAAPPEILATPNSTFYRDPAKLPPRTHRSPWSAPPTPFAGSRPFPSRSGCTHRSPSTRYAPGFKSVKLWTPAKTVDNTCCVDLRDPGRCPTNARQRSNLS